MYLAAPLHQNRMCFDVFVRQHLLNFMMISKYTLRLCVRGFHTNELNFENNIHRLLHHRSRCIPRIVRSFQEFMLIMMYQCKLLKVDIHAHFNYIIKFDSIYQVSTY